MCTVDSPNGYRLLPELHIVPTELCSFSNSRGYKYFVPTEQC